MSASLGTGYHFGPVEALPDSPAEWRALDQAVARWAVAHGGSVQTAVAAGWASWAEGSGHTALPVTWAACSSMDSDRGAWPAFDETDLSALEADLLVWSAATEGSERSQAPFVLDRDHFYLRRSYLAELTVADHIRARAASSDPLPEATEADLDVLFPGEPDPREELQRDAVRRVLGRRFFVLTGGPGTGKTTTVLRMLMMLACDRARRGLPEPVIRAAAPTGKAAQRLSQSLRDGAAQFSHSAELPNVPLHASWQAHLACVERAQSSTLHRLLGSRGTNGFARSAVSPVQADIIVVDEASMVDLALLRVLLEALHDDTVLILVGDADQLTSVGSGSALLDIVSALETRDQNNPTRAPLVRLCESFRADTALIPINEAVRVGSSQAVESACESAGERFEHHDVGTEPECHRALNAWAKRMHQCLSVSGAFDRIPLGNSGLIAKVVDGLRHCQLLCALREGGFGADRAAQVLEGFVRDCIDGDWAGDWYPGRAVMITRNDYTAGLFNGDTGICLQDELGHLAVWFEIDPEPNASEVAACESDARRFICFSPNNLPGHRSAAAITIHKSQGSEYNRVAVLLPPEAEHRILSRQLLYTALSRAKKGIELWATRASFAGALDHQVRRHGALASRISDLVVVPDAAEGLIPSRTSGAALFKLGN